MFKLFCIASVVLFFLCSLSNAQVKEEWVAKYDGPGRNSIPHKIIADNRGNIYVIGISKPDSTYNSDDIVTIKYNSSGAEQWVRTYGGKGYDSPADIATDNSGNVYVAGFFSKGDQADIVTIKYSPSGEELWVRLYDGPGYRHDTPSSIVIDKDNNIYVGGSSDGAGTLSDFVIIKYNTSGEKLWVQRYNGSANTDDYLEAMSYDGKKNIYVSGYSTNKSTWLESLIIKFDTSGRQQWVSKFDEFIPYTMCLDKKGNIYLAGKYKAPLDTVRWKNLTVKYNSAGVKEWGKVHSGYGEEEVSVITADPFGNVLLIITAEVKVEKGLGENMITVKYNSGGDSLWVRKFGEPLNDAGGTSIAVDSKGNVYVTGHAKFDKWYRDFVTIKYDSKGDTLWVERYDGERDKYANSLVLDKDDNVYVTGFRRLEPPNRTDYGIVTIKYKQSK